MAKVVEVWAASGRTVERELTAAEAKQREADAKFAAEASAAQDRLHAKARNDAEAMGFSDEMLAVLFPMPVGGELK